MLMESSVRDREAASLFMQGVQDLLLYFPLGGLSYLGEAVRIEEKPLNSTMCTDGRSVFYHPEWVKAQTRDDLTFDILHEWLHIFYNHVERRGDRDPKLWNIAVDMVVVEQALRIFRTGGRHWNPPATGVIPPSWSLGLTAEEIYEHLKDDASKRPKEDSKGSCHMDLLPELAVSAQEEFRQKFLGEIQQASLIQEAAGKKLPTAIRNRLEDLTKNFVPFGRLLRSYTEKALGADRMTYVPPNKRFFPRFTMPSFRAEIVPRLGLLIDVSASMGPKLMSAFKAAVVPAASSAEETMVVTFDQIVREEVRCKSPRKALNAVQFRTGSHSYTSAEKAFERIASFQPTVIVCLTDGKIRLPKERKNVVFAIPENGVVPPWGKTFKMSLTW